MASPSQGVSSANNDALPRPKCRFLDCKLDYGRNSERNRHTRAKHPDSQACNFYGCDVLLPQEKKLDHMAEHQRVQDSQMNTSTVPTIPGPSVFPHSKDSVDTLSTANNTEATVFTSRYIPPGTTTYFDNTRTLPNDFVLLNDPPQVAQNFQSWPYALTSMHPAVVLSSQAMEDVRYSTYLPNLPVNEWQEWPQALSPNVRDGEDNQVLGNETWELAGSASNELLDFSTQSFIALLEDLDADWDPSEWSPGPQQQTIPENRYASDERLAAETSKSIHE